MPNKLLLMSPNSLLVLVEIVNLVLDPHMRKPWLRHI